MHRHYQLLYVARDEKRRLNGGWERSVGTALEAVVGPRRDWRRRRGSAGLSIVQFIVVL